MMKIVAIDTYPLVLPIKEVYGGAAGFLEDCRTLIVRVETENGIEGWGEATQGRPGNTYETLETMEIMAQKYFAPALIGMDLGRNRCCRQQTSWSSLRPSDHQSGHRDSALRRCGKSISGSALPLFRRAVSARDKLSRWIGHGSGPEAIGARAGQLKQEGFRTFKIKIGQPDHAKDIERVRAVRQAVGDDARFASTATLLILSPTRALSCTSSASFHITDAEQPLTRSDLQASPNYAAPSASRSRHRKA